MPITVVYLSFARSAWAIMPYAPLGFPVIVLYSVLVHAYSSTRVIFTLLQEAAMYLIVLYYQYTLQSDSTGYWYRGTCLAKFTVRYCILGTVQ
jgi:hypothetical protein